MASAAACASNGAPYALSGCIPDTCVTSADVSGYEMGNAVEVLTIAAFAVSSVTCAIGFNGVGTATVCASNNTEYTLSGCTADACIRPVDLSGYSLDAASETLAIAGFAVTGLACASGFGGTPAAAVCASNGAPYTLSGCAPDSCVRPADVTGYEMGNAVEALTLAAFVVSSVTCAGGFNGAAGVATVCSADGDEYTLGGCTADACIRPASLGAYNLDAASETLAMNDFAVTGLACATGNSGTPAAAVCASNGAPYTLSGCDLDACERPEETSGYVMSAAQESLTIAAFAATGITSGLARCRCLFSRILLVPPLPCPVDAPVTLRCHIGVCVLWGATD